ncbi:MAG: hypothetical protein KA138_05830 [Saprospiraceae bacterium]|nr:hypothetical protein [Lewinellaceae bacterium]MBP6811015.1 hypothetical protein [Saprospiraceae bacterium]
MKFDLQNHVRKTLRKRLTEYRNYKLESGTEASIHINAIEIALALVEYALEKDRPIQKEEEIWFEAGIHIYRVLESSDWEDISGLYNQLVEHAKAQDFYRKQ